MTYREYFEGHHDENLSWCRPYRSRNGRVQLALCEGQICGLLIDGEEIRLPAGKQSTDGEIWERICEASCDDDSLSYEGYTWSEIALRDFLVEGGCASCPFNRECEDMDQDVEDCGSDYEDWRGF